MAMFYTEKLTVIIGYALDLKTNKI